MRKLTLLLLTSAVLTMMTASCVWAGDDVNPYAVVPKPPITIGK